MRLKARLLFYGGVLVLLASCIVYATYMPGNSYSGELPASTPELRALSGRLREHVTVLAGNIGTRSLDRAEIMLTDTALYRDPNYHRASDRPEQLNYDALARVTRGIEAVVRALAK